MFSIITPLDSNRLEQFKATKQTYDSMPQKKEFIIPTRSELEIRKYFSEYDLGKDVRIIPYTVETPNITPLLLPAQKSDRLLPY